MNAALCERVGGLLSSTPKIVVNVGGVDYIDSGGIGILVGLFISVTNRGGELKLVSPSQHVTEMCCDARIWTTFSESTGVPTRLSESSKTSSLTFVAAQVLVTDTTQRKCKDVIF
jgi:hypothetical protein